jgi:hypothetical protein
MPQLSQSSIRTLGKTEQLLQTIRKMPLFRQLVPQESGIGFPIPIRRDGKVYATFPCFGFIPVAQGQTTLFPPFSIITINWANQVPVEYVNLRFRSPAPELQWNGEIGSFPHAAISGMSVADYEQHRHQLLALYDELFDNLSSGALFSIDWNDRFSILFSLLLEPPLEPYYRILSPKFCDRFLHPTTN